MNGRERVRRTVQHEVTDRVPVDYCVRDDVSETLRNYLGLADHEAVLQKLGIDIRKLGIGETVPSFLERSGGKRAIRHPDGSIESVWGVVQKPSDDGRYMEMVRGPFYETDDLDSFDWPSLDHIEAVESIKERIDAYGGEYSIFASLNNPFKCCWYMRGLENYLCDTLADEDFAVALWEKTASYELEKGIRFIKAGGDVIAVTGDIAMQDRMMVSPAAWRKIDKPRLASMLETWRSLNPDVMFYFHSDGNMEEVLPDLIAIGFNMINPIQPECMDVDYIKKRYGKDFTLHGTISIQQTLPFGTIEDVRREAENRVALGKEDGGIIIAPSNHVQADTPLENLLEIYRVAGSYQ
jgi:uroporphyrinogen decarboxylase